MKLEFMTYRTDTEKRAVIWRASGDPASCEAIEIQIEEAGALAEKLLNWAQEERRKNEEL